MTIFYAPPSAYQYVQAGNTIKPLIPCNSIAVAPRPDRPIRRTVP